MGRKAQQATAFNAVDQPLIWVCKYFCATAFTRKCDQMFVPTAAGVARFTYRVDFRIFRLARAL